MALVVKLTRHLQANSFSSKPVANLPDKVKFQMKKPVENNFFNSYIDDFFVTRTTATYYTTLILDVKTTILEKQNLVSDSQL